MREILFRGKRKDNAEWVEGDLLQLHDGRKYIVNNKFGACIDDKGNFINTEAPFVCEVIPETVGQYTGLTDKNGKEIFEGDILKFHDRLVVVFWHTHLGRWDSNFLKYTNNENGRDDMSPSRWGYKSEVIGNIHDNPEL